jgi:hypothetical protein
VSSSTTNFNNTRGFTVGHGLIEYYNGVSVVQTGGVDRILYYNSGVQQPTITTVTAPVLHDANSYTRISGHHQVCDTTDFDNTFTGTKAFFDMLTTPITTDEDEQYVIGVIEAYNIRCQYLAQIDTSIPSNNCWQIRYVFRGVTGETFVSFQRGSTSQLFNAGIDTAPFNYKKYALPDSVVLAETYRIQEIQEDETTITRFQFYSAGRVFELDIHCNVGISTTDYTPPVIGDSASLMSKLVLQHFLLSLMVVWILIMKLLMKQLSPRGSVKYLLSQHSLLKVRHIIITSLLANIFHASSSLL